MWLKPGGRATAFRARQWLDAQRVAFGWDATMRVGWIPLRVRDAYEAGRGCLEVRLPLGVRIARATGPEIDRAEAARYLAEIAWVPQALVANDQVAVSAVDADHVDVSCAVDRERVSVRVRVAEDGAPIEAFMPARPRAVGRRFVDTPWRVAYGPLSERGGVVVPESGEAAWELDGGRFTYWRGRIEAYGDA